MSGGRRVPGYAGKRPDNAKKNQAWPGSLTPKGYHVVHSRSQTGTAENRDRWNFEKDQS